MVPDNQSSCPNDERHAPKPALSLSTGQLEGRPSVSDPTPKRHNPLRDEYPSRRDDPRPSVNSDGFSRRRRRPNLDRPTDHPAEVPSPEDAPASKAPSAKPARSRRKRGSHRPRADKRTIALGVVAASLAGVLVMAVAHVGPFAGRPPIDPTKHTGAMSAIAVHNNGIQLVQAAYTEVSLGVPVEPELDKLPRHTPTRTDLEQLSGQKAPFAFTFNETGDAPAPVLSDQSLVTLNNALTFYETDEREAGYLLLDMTTGRGIAGNLDAIIYGASSFKGPFCTYVVQREMPNDINEATSTRTTQIENVIMYSDNASYGELRRAFGNEGMREWLSEAGVNDALVDDTYFPAYTARQSALMWLKIYDYLETANTSAAEWLSNVFSQTEVSFLRNGALGTHSIGQTDYLPEEGSGLAEEYEEEETYGTGGEGEASDASGNEGVGASSDTDETLGLADTGTDEEGQFSVALADSDGTEGQMLSSTEGDEGEGQVLTEPADTEGEEGSEPAENAQGETEEEPAVASLGSNVIVRNKAGWIAGEEDDSICDSGIVTINGHNYLMIIMTSAADSPEGEQAFAHLARTLFEIRADLV